MIKEIENLKKVNDERVEEIKKFTNENHALKRTPKDFQNRKLEINLKILLKMKVENPERRREKRRKRKRKNYLKGNISTTRNGKPSENEKKVKY